MGDLWWLTIAITLLCLLLVAFFWPYRIDLNVQAKGEPDGGWLIAGGVSVTLFALSGVVGRGLPATLQLHAGRFRLWKGEGFGQSEKESPNREDLVSGYRRFSSWFEVASLPKLGWRLIRRMRILQLDCEIDYSFEDVALTGKLLAGFCLLSAVLPPPIHFRHQPDFAAADSLSLVGQGAFRVSFGMCAVTLLWFGLRHVRLGAGLRQLREPGVKPT